MDTLENYYTFFLGIREANITHRGSSRNLRTELEIAILKLLIDKLNKRLSHFFKINYALECNFDNESIEDGGYKLKVYYSIINKVSSFIDSKIPTELFDTKSYIINYFTFADDNSGKIVKTKNAEISNSKIPNSCHEIDIYLNDINELYNEIYLQHLGFLEELSNQLESVANLKNKPDANEYKIIKNAKRIYDDKGGKKYISKREALIEANENEGYLFKEIEIKTIRYRKEEKLVYLVSKKFTDDLEHKWKGREETEQKNKLKIRLDNKHKRKGG